MFGLHQVKIKPQIMFGLHQVTPSELLVDYHHTNPDIDQTNQVIDQTNQDIDQTNQVIDQTNPDIDQTNQVVVLRRLSG